MTTEEVTAAEPLPVNIDSINIDCHYANLITLKKVKLERVDGGIWAVGQGDRRIKLWNTFQLSKISVPKIIENKRFDVTGILMTRITDDTLIDELALMAAVVEVPYDPSGDDAQGIGGVIINDSDNASAIYTPDGRRLDNTVGDHRRPGLYIIKKGNKVIKVVSR